MSYPVKFFHSEMQGAPVLSNNWGDLIGVLDGCLVTGFNLKAADSITLTGSTATAVVSTGHLYKVDQVLLIAGCDQAAYNGEQRVTNITANSFSFEVTGTPASPATTQSNISVKVAPLGWEKPFSGTHKAAYRSTDPASPRHYLRVDDSLKQANGFNAYDTSWAKWANVGICESMTDIDTIVGAQAPFDPNYPEQNWKQRAGWHWGWHKWVHGRRAGVESGGDGGAGARNWVIVGDGRFFYLMNSVQPGFNWFGRGLYCFGDFPSFKPGDAYNTMLKAQDLFSSQLYFNYPFEHGHGGLLGTLDSAGVVVLRNHTQLGNPVRLNATTLNLNNGQLWNGRGGLPFPNACDFALWMLPVYLRQEDANMRGMLPGCRWLPQDRPYSDLTIVDNVVNEAGRKFLLARYSHSSEQDWGQIAFDITGPWR